MSIKLRLTIGLVTVILFSFFLGFYTLMVQDRLARGMTNLELLAEKRKLLADLQLATEKLLMPANDYIITGKTSYQQEFEGLAEETTKLFQAIRSNGNFSKAEMEFVDKSYALFRQVLRAGEDVFRLSFRDPRQPELMEIMDYKYADPMVKELGELNGHIRGAFAKAQKEADETRLASRRNVIVAIVLMTVVLVAAGYLQRRSIARSLDSLVTIMGEIANGSGDLTKRITVTSSDELGILGDCFNRFADQVQSMMREVVAAADEVSQSAQHIAATSRNVHKVASRQFSAIEGTSQATELLNVSITGIADDASRILDLSSTAASSSHEISESIASIAGLTDNLDSVSDAALSSVNEITVSFKQVAGSIKELSDRADSVVTSAVQINSAAKSIQKYARDQAEMAETIKDEALSAGLDTVRKTRERMEKIRSEVASTADIMNGLGTVSTEIGRIVGMIEEITEKTRMLALNASILAAQAGLKGKGFGVVAEEVKALAQQTARSTDEISTMVRHVQQGMATAIDATTRSSREVEDGVRLSVNAESILTTIIGKTEESVAKAMNVARATEEQTMGVTVVTEAIQQIQQMIGQIRTAVTEQRKASDEILAASEGVHSCTRETKENIAVQSDEIQCIARLFQEMHEKMQVIVKTTVEQQRSSTDIVDALEAVNLQAQENVKLANGLDGVVSKLETQSHLLASKIGSFRI